MKNQKSDSGRCFLIENFSSVGIIQCRFFKSMRGFYADTFVFDSFGVTFYFCAYLFFHVK